MYRNPVDAGKGLWRDVTPVCRAVVERLALTNRIDADSRRSLLVGCSECGRKTANQASKIVHPKVKVPYFCLECCHVPLSTLTVTKWSL